MKSIATSLASTIVPGIASEKAEKDADQDDHLESRVPDYDKVVKRLIAHETELPSSKETPCFNHYSYYANLNHYNRNADDLDRKFGKYLLYGEVLTSTSTLLEK